MKAFNLIVLLFALTAITGTGYAFTVLNGFESAAPTHSDDRVILGHRIGSNGQEILVYAE